MILYGLRTYDFNDQNDQRWGLKSLRSFRSLGHSFSTEVIFGNRTALKKTTLPPQPPAPVPPAWANQRPLPYLDGSIAHVRREILGL